MAVRDQDKACGPSQIASSFIAHPRFPHRSQNMSRQIANCLEAIKISAEILALPPDLILCKRASHKVERQAISSGNCICVVVCECSGSSSCVPGYNTPFLSRSRSLRSHTATATRCQYVSGPGATFVINDCSFTLTISSMSPLSNQSGVDSLSTSTATQPLRS
jgi:hypothetical protein